MCISKCVKVGLDFTRFPFDALLSFYDLSVDRLWMFYGFTLGFSISFLPTHFCNECLFCANESVCGCLFLLLLCVASHLVCFRLFLWGCFRSNVFLFPRPIYAPYNYVWLPNQDDCAISSLYSFDYKRHRTSPFVVCVRTQLQIIMYFMNYYFFVRKSVGNP